MTPRTRKRILAALAWVVGLAVIGLLVAQQDSAELIGALSAAGWWLPVFVLAFLGTLFLDSLGWRAVILHDRSVALVGLIVRRWVGVSVNALLPVAQLGGEVVRARLLRQLGPSGPVAAAGVIVDLTIGLLTQILFALLGLLLAAVVLGADKSLISLGLGLSLFALLVLAFALLQMRGTLTSSVDLIGRFVTNGVWLQLADGAARLDEQIRAIYAQKRRTLACALWRLLGWLWPCLDLWLIFWILGHPISLAEAVMLEAVAQVVRSAGFGIPGGLGVQEGGVMLAAALLGVPTELALAAMLIRRVREFACGLAGLVAWLVLEGRGRESVAVA